MTEPTRNDPIVTTGLPGSPVLWRRQKSCRPDRCDVEAITKSPTTSRCRGDEKVADDERADIMTQTAPSLCPDPELAPSPLHKNVARWCISRESNQQNPTSTCAPSNAPRATNVDQYIVEYGTNAAWALIVR